MSFESWPTKVDSVLSAQILASAAPERLGGVLCGQQEQPEVYFYSGHKQSERPILASHGQFSNFRAAPLRVRIPASATRERLGECVCVHV